MVNIWLAIIIGFAILEAVTMDLSAIWFAFGALIAMIVAVFTNSVTIQMTFFIVGSTIFLILFRPMLKKVLFKKETQKTNIDMIIGETGIATTDVTCDGGEVKVCGKIWTAINNDKDGTILTNEKVEILQIKGSKIIVKLIK